MELADLLARQRSSMIAAAEAGLARAHSPHYESAGADEVRRRLDALFACVERSLEARDLEPVVSYARGVAEQRFAAGYDLAEVQAAFNALEEAIWTQALAELEPSQLAEALGLVTTILGAGKDALARRYVSLAADTHAPSLDLRALFAGTQGP